MKKRRGPLGKFLVRKFKNRTKTSPLRSSRLSIRRGISEKKKPELRLSAMWSKHTQRVRPSEKPSKVIIAPPPVENVQLIVPVPIETPPLTLEPVLSSPLSLKTQDLI